ncbi:unnamed protein product [Lota lota]
MSVAFGRDVTSCLMEGDREGVLPTKTFCFHRQTHGNLSESRRRRRRVFCGLHRRVFLTTAQGVGFGPGVLVSSVVPGPQGRNVEPDEDAERV